MNEYAAGSGTADEDQTRARAWLVALSWTGIALAALIALYAGTFASMVTTWWRSETFAHGFLIAPVSAWLIWNRRNLLAVHMPAAAPWQLPALAAITALWLLATVANVQVVMQFAAVTMILAIVLALLGGRIFGALLFPLLYLYFTVPFGEFLVPLLQDVTATTTVSALQLTGVPVFREGIYFSIPSGRFEVAEACSGLRYLIASVALGVLFAWLFFVRTWKRLLFIALCVVVPVLANGLRAFGIVMIADLSNYELAVGIDHFIYGWLFFAIVMGLLFWLGLALRDPRPAPARRMRAAPASAPPGPAGRRHARTALAILAILATGHGLALYLQRHSDGETALPLLSLPKTMDGFRQVSADPADLAWRGSHPGASQEAGWIFQDDRGDIAIHIAWYAAQRQGSELIRLGDRLVGDGWRVLRKVDGEVTDHVGRRQPVRRILIDDRRRSLLVYQWYLIDGEAVISPVAAKIRETLARLRGGSAGSATVILAVGHEGDDADAEARGDDFYRVLSPYLVDIFAGNPGRFAR